MAPDPTQEEDGPDEAGDAAKPADQTPGESSPPERVGERSTDRSPDDGTVVPLPEEQPNGVEIVAAQRSAHHARTTKLAAAALFGAESLEAAFLPGCWRAVAPEAPPLWAGLVLPTFGVLLLLIDLVLEISPSFVPYLVTVPSGLVGGLTVGLVCWSLVRACAWLLKVPERRDAATRALFGFSPAVCFGVTGIVLATLSEGHDAKALVMVALYWTMASLAATTARALGSGGAGWRKLGIGVGIALGIAIGGSIIFLWSAYTPDLSRWLTELSAPRAPEPP